jgi:hypothetical protein
MIAEIPASALQIPDNALWILAGWVLSTLLVGWSGYRWGLHSQVAAKKLEVKTNMLPQIEKFIIRAKATEGNDWFGLRPESIGQLLEPSIKLKSLLKGNRRKLLIEAWETFSQTTPAEFHIPQPHEEGEKEEKMRQLFLNRMEALKSAVENC